jgi:hypothetical protein
MAYTPAAAGGAYGGHYTDAMQQLPPMNVPPPNYHYASAAVEPPTRAMNGLCVCARAHAFGVDLNVHSDDDTDDQHERAVVREREQREARDREAAIARARLRVCATFIVWSHLSLIT